MRFAATGVLVLNGNLFVLWYIMLTVKCGTHNPPLRQGRNINSNHNKTTTQNPNKNLSKNEVNSAFSLKIGKAF
jgi:hypothetical protein